MLCQVVLKKYPWAQGTKDLTFNIKINHYYYSRISSARDYKSTGTLNISLDIRCIRDFCKKMAKSYSAVTIIQLSGLNTKQVILSDRVQNKQEYTTKICVGEAECRTKEASHLTSPLSEILA